MKTKHFNPGLYTSHKEEVYNARHMRKETKFNYGLLLFGAAMPPIVDAVAGPRWGLAALVIIAGLGLVLLILGHFHKEEGETQSRFLRLGKFALVGLVIAFAIIGVPWAIRKSQQHSSEPLETVSKKEPQLPIETHTEPSKAEPPSKEDKSTEPPKIEIKKEPAIAEAKKRSSKRKEEKPLTLRTLFDRDFLLGGPARDMEEMIGTNSPNPVRVKFTARLWMDFHEGTEFFGFYIPRQSEQPDESSKITVRLARNLPSQLIELRQLLKTLQVTIPGDEGSAYKSEDLILSHNVYIYHEDSLSVQEISVIVSQFESQNLKLQLRGSHYLYDQQALRLLRLRPQPSQ